MTQDQNSSCLNPPKEKDGTLRKNKLEQEANWYGPSQAPQEEFTENSPPPADPDSLENERSRMSEGKPTFSRDGTEGDKVGVPGEESVNSFTDGSTPVCGTPSRSSAKHATSSSSKGSGGRPDK